MTKEIASVLLAVAKELEQEILRSLPQLRDRETIRDEWFSNGIYHRETELDGRISVNEFDFRDRKCRNIPRKE